MSENTPAYLPPHRRRRKAVLSRWNLFNGLPEVLVDRGQEVALGRSARLQVVGADVPELGQGRVAHQEPSAGVGLLDGVAEPTSILPSSSDR